MADILTPEQEQQVQDYADQYQTEATQHQLIGLKLGSTWREGYANAQQMLYNASEAEKNRAWQEMMSNTAYQRAVKDAAAAGINPFYVVSNGGASSPGGASASMGSAAGPATGRGFLSALGPLVMLIVGLARLAAGDPGGAALAAVPAYNKYGHTH